MLTVNFITPSKMIVVPLMPKRFRFEVIDDNGNKISLGLEGYFSKEQVERLLRLVSEVSEIISLPIISTYLARLCKMGYLERKGGSRRMVYRLTKAKRSDQAQYE